MMTYQNIKLNNVRSIDARLLNDQYYDFMLYKGESYGASDPSDLSIADFSCPFDMEDGRIYSTTTWQDAVNEGVDMEDIGFTGIDNGLITFRKDRISNQDFLNIFTGSTYSIDADDTRLFLSPVTGNTLNFDYPMTIEEEDGGCYLALQGGFYQGFYKLHGFDYQTLPNGVDLEWNISFVIRPRSDYEVGTTTVNYLHPENKGMFFYMGTRAENKFWSFYKTDSGVTEELKREDVTNDGYLDPSVCGESGDTLSLKISVNDQLDYMNVEPPVEIEGYFSDGYQISASTPDCPCAQQSIDEEKEKNAYSTSDYFAFDEYLSDPCTFVLTAIEDCRPEPIKKSCSCNAPTNPSTVANFSNYGYKENSSCCKNEDKGSCSCNGDYTSPCDCDDYFQDEYFEENCAGGDKAIEEDYMQSDVTINEKKLTDSFGHEFVKKGYYEIESDNKFLMFDRTKDGFNVHNWVEGTKVTLTGRQDWSNLNYFLVMDRTCTGYTVNNIDKYQEANSKSYDVYKDIKNNAFGLRITDEGAIGYRYAVLDCDADNDEHYSVIEEYSKDGVIKTDEWNSIVVKMSIINPTAIKCDPYKGKRKMKLYFYVNGFLVFISKELNEFNFKELNDVYQKQEAVPYSISLGGGTQGLLESILPDYYNTPNYIFPIEKSFCGTFLGDIKSFKIYNGAVNYLTIRNYLSENKI